MKINLITTALVAILGLALAGAPVTVQAQTSTSDTTTAPAKAKKAGKLMFKGSITAIDATSVTVAGKKKTQTLAITAQTKFKLDKAAGTASDFAVGDEVSGTYTTDSSGATTADVIRKKTAAGGKTPAPAAQ